MSAHETIGVRMKVFGNGIICLLFFFGASLEGREPECYRQLANHFFDDDKAIMQALSLHQVSESTWTPIVRDLQRNSRYILPLARQQARFRDNNPLDPFDKEPAGRLLESAIIEVFSSVLKNYLVTNSSDINQMVGYIKSRQPLWVDCFGNAARK